VSEGPISKALLPAIDHLIDARYAPARASAARLRDASWDGPPRTAEQIADALIASTRRELAAIGAAAGGAAAVPGVGTAASMAASTADVSWTVTRLGELIMAIGTAYGHTSDSIEERRAWVLSVLGMATGASKGVRGLAQQVGSRGGARLVSAIPTAGVARVNRVLGGRIITKFGTQQGVIRLGRLVPFGVGAAIGAAGNAALVQVVGVQAKRFFDVSG
jgi:hypothetical protein